MIKTEIIQPYYGKFTYYGKHVKHIKIKQKSIKELLTELGNNVNNYLVVCYVISHIQAGKLGLK